MREDGGPGLRVTVRLASPLRPHAGGAAVVTFVLDPPVTVAAVLGALAQAHPAVGRRLRDEAGRLRPHVNVFVGSVNARDLDGTGTVVPEGAEVSVLPAISGGCS